MTKKVLIIAVIIALADAVIVSHVHAHNKMMGIDHNVPAPQMNTVAMDAEQYYPVMIVKTSEPVQIPGHMLGPGEYSFELINSNEEVLVSKLDGSESYGPYLLSPAWRRDDSGGLIVTAGARDGGAERILSWYFANQHDGYAFRDPAGETR